MANRLKSKQETLFVAQGDDLDEVVYTDKDFVIKKLVADQSVKGAHPMTIHQETNPKT